LSSLVRAIRSQGRLIETELSWIASLVLFYSTVYVILDLDVLWISYGVCALTLYVLPIVATRDPFRAVPWEITLLLAVPILLHISEGSQFLGERLGWWNDVTSLAFAFSLSTIGFLLTIELQMYTAVRMNNWFAAFFVVMFTLGIAGLWTVGEYLADQFAGTSNLTSNEAVMQNLTWVTVGAVAMGFVYAGYRKAMSEKRQKNLGIVRVWEVPGWKGG